MNRVNESHKPKTWHVVFDSSSLRARVSVWLCVCERSKPSRKLYLWNRGSKMNTCCASTLIFCQSEWICFVLCGSSGDSRNSIRSNMLAMVGLTKLKWWTLLRCTIHSMRAASNQWYPVRFAEHKRYAGGNEKRRNDQWTCKCSTNANRIQSKVYRMFDCTNWNVIICNTKCFEITYIYIHWTVRASHQISVRSLVVENAYVSVPLAAAVDPSTRRLVYYAIEQHAMHLASGHGKDTD